MLTDTLGAKLTTDFISVVNELGYPTLASWLEKISRSGTHMQQKRIVDCWVMLSINIGDSWKEDREIREFLGTLEHMLQLRNQDPGPSLWWLRGAYYVLSHLPETSPDYPHRESFYQRLLEAVIPNVLGL